MQLIFTQRSGDSSGMAPAKSGASLGLQEAWNRISRDAQLEAFISALLGELWWNFSLGEKLCAGYAITIFQRSFGNSCEIRYKRA